MSRLIKNKIRCKKCGLDFDEFLHTGNFRCNSCYDQFESMIDPILKNIHGSNRHVGRLGNVIEGNNISNDEKIFQRAVCERYDCRCDCGNYRAAIIDRFSPGIRCKSGAGHLYRDCGRICDCILRGE